MRDKEGMKFDCIFEEPLDFIDIDYTHLNKTIRYEERPHGEWKPDGTCSECGVYSSLNKNTAYFCPNCGSDNRKREGDEENQNPCIKCSAESVCQGICEKRYLWNLRKEGDEK